MKHLALVLALVVGVAACGKKHDAPKLADALSIFEECWSAQSRGEFAQVGLCYVASATVQSPGTGLPPVVGRDKILEAMIGLRAAFPDLKATPELMLSNGANVAAIVRLSGTSAQTKKPVGVTGGVLVTMSGSAIVSEADYFDSQTIAAQLAPDPAHPARAWDATPTVATAKVIAANDAKETANVEVVHKLFREFDSHDLTAFGALIADDATWSESAEPKDWTKAELLADHGIGMKAFSDLAMFSQSMWGAGDYVVQTGDITGTNDGPLPGLPAPTQKKISIPYLGIFHVVNGKVAQAWLFAQGSAFVTQLGLK